MTIQQIVTFCFDLLQMKLKIYLKRPPLLLCVWVIWLERGGERWLCRWLVGYWGGRWLGGHWTGGRGGGGTEGRWLETDWQAAGTWVDVVLGQGRGRTEVILHVQHVGKEGLGGGLQLLHLVLYLDRFEGNFLARSGHSQEPWDLLKEDGSHLDRGEEIGDRIY